MAQSATVLKEDGFSRKTNTYWSRELPGIRWELGIEYEPAYGEGVFRIRWGVRAPELDSILFGQVSTKDDIEYTSFGGDLGTFVEQRGGWMKLLAVQSARPSLTARLLFGLRPRNAAELNQQISRWFRQFADETRDIDGPEPLGEFFSAARLARLKGFDILPGEHAPIYAAIRAIHGDPDGAAAILERLRSEQNLHSPKNGTTAAVIDEIQARIEALR